MAEVLVTYPEAIIGSDGRTYTARACGSTMDESRWQGWIEFEPIDGGAQLRSARETTQPNRVDTVYWATGLTPVYLEGALERTLKPNPATAAALPPPVPAFDRPGPSMAEAAAPVTPSVLNPYSVYRKGEALLRGQLSALAGWHLVNIIRDYQLSDETADQLSLHSPPELIDIIVAAVKNPHSDLIER